MTRRICIVLASFAVLAFAAPSALAGQLDSLRFMAGSWAGGGKAKSFEYFRIEEREDGLWYLTQPRGQAATAFKAKEVSASRVVFEKLDHDFPQRIIYWRDKPGELRARIEGDVKGKLQGAQWTWAASTLDH